MCKLATLQQIRTSLSGRYSLINLPCDPCGLSASLNFSCGSFNDAAAARRTARQMVNSECWKGIYHYGTPVLTVYSTVVTMCTASLTLNNSTFCHTM